MTTIWIKDSSKIEFPNSAHNSLQNWNSVFLFIYFLLSFLQAHREPVLIFKFSRNALKIAHGHVVAVLLL